MGSTILIKKRSGPSVLVIRLPYFTFAFVKVSIMANYRKYLPKSSTDTFATIFTLVGINGIAIFELFYVSQWILTHNPDYSTFLYNFHVTCGLYIYISAMGAFWKTIVTESSIRGMMLPTFTKEGWRFCPYCECNSPPRSYHCYMCKVCVLRRDHHCVFTGNCIGHRNHRFYLQLVFFCWLAAAYATFMNTDIIGAVIAQTGPLGIFKIIFPFVVWVSGYITFTEMLVAAMVLFCFAVMCMMAALLFYHMRNLYFGQITTERTYKKFTYDLGWKGNMKSVFGNRWTYAWISPWIPSQLPGDGLEFPVIGQYECPKDI